MNTENRAYDVSDRRNNDIIIRKMLQIDPGIYGYQDKYIGRMPRLLHNIEGTNIWECNPEYSGLMFEYITGNLNKYNVSQELLNKIKEDLYYIFRLDLNDSEERKKILTCIGFGPTGNIYCENDLSCDDIMICDYYPFNKYDEYPPYQIFDFEVSKDLIGEVRINWTPTSLGSQPIFYDLIRIDPDGSHLYIPDVEPNSIISVPYGPALFQLIARNTYGNSITEKTEGEALLPIGIGKDCCSTISTRCLQMHVMAENGVEIDNFNSREGPFYTSYYHGSCDNSIPPYNNECHPEFPCDGEECPNCLGFNVYNVKTKGFDAFYDIDASRLKVSDIHGVCRPEPLKLGLVCDGGSETLQFTVKHPTLPIQEDFYAQGEAFITQPDCPICIDFNVWDKTNKKFVKFVSYEKRYTTVSRTHGACVDSSSIPQVPSFGNMCECSPCESCLRFNTYESDGLMHKFSTLDGEFFVSLEHGECGKLNIVNPHDYGYNCSTEDDECPDCIFFKVFDGYDDRGLKVFSQLISFRSKFVIGHEFNGCNSGGFIPTLPRNVTATNNELGRVLVEWDEPEYNSPECTYDIYRNGSLIGYDLTETRFQDSVGSGIYGYKIVAKNMVDSSEFTEAVYGESLSTTNEPNSVIWLEASRDREGQILITFEESTSGEPEPTYALYVNGTEIVTDIDSGYLWDCSPGIYELYIRAENINGIADSEVVEGKSLSVHELFYTVSAKLFNTFPAKPLKVKV